MRIKDKIAQLRQITEAKQEKALLQLIQEDERWITDLNKVQLLEGKDSNDSMLTAYRSPSYAKYKLKFNPLGVTDLRLTGKFHDSFVLKAKSFPLVIDAKDKKRNDLVKKYGKAIFGLTQESKELLVERLKKKTRAYYRKLIGV